MFSFLKSITGFGSQSTTATADDDLIREQLNDDLEDHNEEDNDRDADKDGDQLSDTSFTDSSDDDMPLTNGCRRPVVVDRLNGRKDLKTNDEEEEEGVWNDEWKAVEELASDDRLTLVDIDGKSVSVKGMITECGDNEIVVDEKHRIKYSWSTFGQLFTGDLVNVETIGAEVLVKPLRFKILTGKISEYQRNYNRYIFSQHAVIRKTDETKHLRVGDVVKMIVIETRNDVFNWRAIIYNKLYDPEEGKRDQIDVYTDDLMANKNSIEITDGINFKEMRVGTEKKIFVYIKNRSKRAQTLVSCEAEEGENQIRFNAFFSSYSKPSAEPYVIAAESESYVELLCDAKYCGDYSELLVFVFEGFKIGRFVTVTVLDGARYGNERRRLYGTSTWIVPGERVWNSNKHIFDKLSAYKVPEQLWRVIENNWSIDTVFPELQQSLNKDNYRLKFHALIYLEECENQLNLQTYDISEAQFRRCGRFLGLTVPGLADGRPSLIISDRVIAFDDQKHTTNEDKIMGYEGFIHDIKRDEILLRFNDDFHRDFNGGVFKVMFQLSRTLYRRCHHAIDLSPHIVDQVLFPHKVILKQPFKKIPFESIQWFNKSLNLQQKLAVVASLKGHSRPTPYVIFGPPGTGKTVTIVESILQVFDKLGDSRIIACTAANSSADLIAQKLLESGRVSETDLIRVSALHRMNSIPEAVKKITQSADEDEKKWIYHRIIVTTTSQAGVVFRYKISPSHFTHVFIDEAAQVTEPESLIPITMSAIGHGVVVLAGDHKQLGPVVMSKRAKDNKLCKSLMERLMTTCEPYARSEAYAKYGKYNPRFTTKLVQNYRSDGLIMSIPSQLFYDNELVFNCETDANLLDALGFKSPLCFVGVRGDDRQEADCPSWFNPQEIIQVCTYLEKLYKAGVKPEEIGIITPYRKQVTKLRTHMRDCGLEDCRVATIEEFQGLEKRVIIVSMVRSNYDNLSHDMKYNLGFVHNAKRFNVAISRAMSLLICVGDPYLLKRDQCWAKLLEYCLENNYYKGCAFGDYNPFIAKRSPLMG